MKKLATFGRRKIYTSESLITQDNVVEVLSTALAVHRKNAKEISYLFRYDRGDQPILRRRKTVRPEIQDNTVVNHAAEITSFKVSYLLSQPITYINRSGDSQYSEKVNRLNDMMYLCDKAAKDKELADDFTICGTAYRFIMPNRLYTANSTEEAPYNIYTLDPESTFLIHHTGIGEPVVAGVRYVAKKPGATILSKQHNIENCIYTVYTPTARYDIDFSKENKIIHAEENPLGEVPIIEYVNNDFRIGAFEVVEDILNAINTLESNRIEATEQTVQSLLWANNVDFDDKQIAKLRATPSPFIVTKSSDGMKEATIKEVSANLNQSDQQVLLNSLYKQVLSITGMPSTGDGNTADSSNNGAVIVRNGWQHAESRAKDTEMLWRRSERKLLKVALDICRRTPGVDLDIPLSAVVEKFTRRNYEDIMTKATVLTTLLSNDKVHPHFAYTASGIAVDTEEAYTEGMEWHKEVTASTAEPNGADESKGDGADD